CRHPAGGLRSRTAVAIARRKARSVHVSHGRAHPECVCPMAGPVVQWCLLKHLQLLVVLTTILRQGLYAALATLFIEPAPVNVPLRGVDAVHDAVARNNRRRDPKAPQRL